MTQSNEPGIEQMNKAIASFMGYEKYEDNSGVWFKKEGLIISMHPKLEDLCYHEKWELLMPVVEKIEQLNDDVVLKIYTSINGKSCSLWNYFDVKGILRQDSELNCPFSQRYTGKTKIEAVHKAVYQFIQWLNQQKQNNG